MDIPTRPWGSETRGAPKPYILKYERRVIMLDRGKYKQFHTLTDDYESGNEGIDIDDLLVLLPGLFKQLKLDGWTIEPPRSR